MIRKLFQRTHYGRFGRNLAQFLLPRARVQVHAPAEHTLNGKQPAIIRYLIGVEGGIYVISLRMHVKGILLVWDELPMRCGKMCNAPNVTHDRKIWK